jgi:NADH-quinone oxidoreductase subunit E
MNPSPTPIPGPSIAREFSAEARKQIAWARSRYPVKEAALLPVLRIAEREFGVIDQGGVECVARELALSPGHVWGVLTFYTHYRREGDGTYVVQVCSTLPCALRGSGDVLRRLEETLGIKAGQTTRDGKFTLKKVECLGSCDTAPVAQINDDYHEHLTLDRLDAILDSLD